MYMFKIILCHEGGQASLHNGVDTFLLTYLSALKLFNFRVNKVHAKEYHGKSF